MCMHLRRPNSGQCNADGRGTAPQVACIIDPVRQSALLSSSILLPSLFLPSLSLPSLALTSRALPSLSLPPSDRLPNLPQ
jgi:hypothetical protein